MSAATAVKWAALLLTAWCGFMLVVDAAYGDYGLALVMGVCMVVNFVTYKMMRGLL